ncbi:MAG: hydrogenase nickel incorporation protein HypB [Candidatus Cloacimonetes bacterium]|nr:hydrogenase nickel incorporation protein HypB [Candidatus Cloacimonadota bacterium]
MCPQDIKIMQRILTGNDQIAAEVRASLAGKGIACINLMSSPGSGKTTLLQKTATKLNKGMFVIEGDIYTTLDSERLQSAGIGVYQINTGPFGGDCHLEAAWIRSALNEIDLAGIDFLFIENIGNLVCPAEFDIGAHKNIVVLSVTEGEDKPLKYPLAFRNAQLCLISKVDLLPYLDLNLNELKQNIKRINPQLMMIEISSIIEKGLDDWINFIMACRQNAPEG